MNILTQINTRLINVEVSGLKNSDWFQEGFQYELVPPSVIAKQLGLRLSIVKELASRGEIPSAAFQGKLYIVAKLPKCPNCQPSSEIDFSSHPRFNGGIAA